MQHLSLAMALTWGLTGSARAGHDLAIEAESLTVQSGWQVIRGRQGFSVGQPMLWSANRLRADADDTPASAQTVIYVPETGAYNLWVRYDSPYGFDTLFTVEIHQGGRVQEGRFGGKAQRKYFPFGRGWQVQGPWHWHNSDFVYQKMPLHLVRGRATLVLRKGRNGHPAAARVVDLFYLTDDLRLEPGDDWSWLGDAGPAILSRFRRPIYGRVKRPAGEVKTPLVRIYYRMWLLGYYKGPREEYWLTPEAIMQQKPSAEPAASGSPKWLRLDLSSVMPALFTVSSGSPAEIELSTRPDGQDAVAFPVGETPIEIIAATGNAFYEEALLRGRPAVRLADYLERLTQEVEQTRVVGRRARRFGLTSGFGGRVDGFDLRRLAAACGLTGQYYRMDPEVYGPEGEPFGFNRTQGYIGLQNDHLNQACYEGDYSELERSYRERFEALRAQGLGEVPQNIKLIEEAGPPGLSVLRTWPKINEAFRAYLRERGVPPLEVLSREALVQLLSSGADRDENALWDLVTLGLGTPEEAATHPALFYHSLDFQTWLFARNCAAAVRLIESIFPPGSHGNSGSFYPSTGGTAVLAGGVEPFRLFRERGATSFSSEISWGLNTPEYVGPQTESYGVALGRALTRYSGGPIGNLLIVDGNRGYSPEFAELASYAMAAQGASWWDFYTLGYPAECNVFGHPEILKSLRRISFALGAVEDLLLDSDVVPARVAIGWSRTTDIWDLAEPEKTPHGPGNTLYPQERCNLYLLLRHLQLPVDLLSEDDVAEGALKGYRIFFLVGDHLTQEAAEALGAWVEAGGFLIAVAGGGLRDIYNHPLPAMERLFGIKGATLRKEAQALRPKLELLHAEPLDSIVFDLPETASTLPAFGYRQGLDVEEGRVVGRFRDGTPAAVLNEVGRGKALLIGALPGIAYLKEAFPLLPFGRGGEDLMGCIFPAYNAPVRELVQQLLALAPEAWAAAASPVVSREPLVEVTVRRKRGTDEFIVALVNFSGKPLSALALEVQPARLDGATEVRAAFSKLQQTQGADGALHLTLPLDRFEVLAFRKP